MTRDKLGAIDSVKKKYIFNCIQLSYKLYALRECIFERLVSLE